MTQWVDGTIEYQFMVSESKITTKHNSFCALVPQNWRIQISQPNTTKPMVLDFELCDSIAKKAYALCEIDPLSRNHYIGFKTHEESYKNRAMAKVSTEQTSPSNGIVASDDKLVLGDNVHIEFPLERGDSWRKIENVEDFYVECEDGHITHKFLACDKEVSLCNDNRILSKLITTFQNKMVAEEFCQNKTR